MPLPEEIEIVEVGESFIPLIMLDLAPNYKW